MNEMIVSNNPNDRYFVCSCNNSHVILCINPHEMNQCTVIHLILINPHHPTLVTH